MRFDLTTLPSVPPVHAMALDLADPRRAAAAGADRARA